METWSEIPDGFQLFKYPAVPKLIGVGFWLQALSLGGICFGFDNRFNSALGREHSTFHSVVNALDLWNVKETRRTTDQTTPWELKLWNALVTTFDQSSRTICYPTKQKENILQESSEVRVFP